jgi:NADP+-dependent farnesol dehydrogenase
LQNTKFLIEHDFYRFVGLLDEVDETTNELKKIIDVNLTGTMFCSRAALRTMKTKELGYIININSINGHFIPYPTENLASYNTYAPSKYGITAFTECLRQELAASSQLRDKIRCTSLSPGEVKTDMVEASGFKGPVDEYFATVPSLNPEDIAEGVTYILSTPKTVNVTELTIRPTGERV